MSAFNENAVFNREDELRYFWRTSGQCRQLLRNGGPVEEVEECVADLTGIYLNTDQPVVRRQCTELLEEYALWLPFHTSPTERAS